MAIVSKVRDGKIVLTERDAVVLTIEESLNGKSVVVAPQGNLRNDTAHFFGDELKLLVLLKKDLVIDMKGVTYMSSACSEALLAVQRTIDEAECGSMLLRNIPDPVMKEMRETGLSELLMIEEAEG